MTRLFSPSAASPGEHRLIRMGAEAPQGPQETPQAPEVKLEQKKESTLKEPASDDEALAQAREDSSRTDRDVMKKLGDALKNKAENAAKELSATLDNALKNMPDIARKIGKEMAEKAGIQKPEGVAADAENPMGPQKGMTLKELGDRAKQLQGKAKTELPKEINGALGKAEQMASDVKGKLNTAIDKLPGVAKNVAQAFAVAAGVREGTGSPSQSVYTGEVPPGFDSEQIQIGDLRNANEHRVENWELYLVPMILRDPVLSQEYGELIANFKRGTLSLEDVQQAHMDTVQALQARGIRDNQIEGLRPRSEAEMHAFWQLLVDKGLQVPVLPEQQAGDVVLGAGVMGGEGGKVGEQPKEGEKPAEKKEEGMKTMESLPKGDGQWHAVPKEGGGEDGYEYSRQKDGRMYRKNAADIAEVRSDDGKEWKSVVKEAEIDTMKNPETASIYNAVIATGKMDAWKGYKMGGEVYWFMISSADKKLYSQELGLDHRTQKFDGGKWGNAVG